MVGGGLPGVWQEVGEGICGYAGQVCWDGMHGLPPYPACLCLPPSLPPSLFSLSLSLPLPLGQWLWWEQVMDSNGQRISSNISLIPMGSQTGR